jgi:phage baseplate assembly protein W
MAKYRDFSFNRGIYGKAAEYTDAAAVILAIKNILLTRPGNFPFNPSFGMNIEKYQFDLLDQQQVNIIKSELSDQISKYIPSLNNVFVDVQIVEDPENKLGTGQGVLGIKITSNLNSEPLSIDYLLYKDNDVLNIFNEIH